MDGEGGTARKCQILVSHSGLRPHNQCFSLIRYYLGSAHITYMSFFFFFWSPLSNLVMSPSVLAVYYLFLYFKGPSQPQ